MFAETALQGVIDYRFGGTMVRELTLKLHLRMSFPRKRESIFTVVKTYYVYIMASKRNGTLYTGVTSDLLRRVYEHKNDLADGFTRKYQVHHLVYYEETNDVRDAIEREKNIKKWRRQWKIELVEGMNPEWKDLYDEIF